MVNYGGTSYTDTNSGYGNQQGASNSGQWNSVFRSGSGKLSLQDRGWVNIWALIFGPPICLALILCLSLIPGCLLWLPFVLMFIVGLVFVYMMYHRSQTAQATFGLLCLLAIVIAFIVALFAHGRWLSQYRRISAGASYSNIFPASAAETYNDGTTFEFVNGTKVDSSRTYGYLDSYATGGTVYCVAPISSDPAQTMKIQFWVVGKDCCLQRSIFSCNGAADPNARGGVALLDYDEQYADAVKGAETAFGLTPNDHFRLITWRNDPVHWTSNLWHSTQVLFLAFTGGYLLLSCCVGITVDRSLKS